MTPAQILEIVKRQYGDEFEIQIYDEDIYAWIYEAELDIIRRTGYNESSTTALSTAFPTEVPNSVNIRRIKADGRDLRQITKDELSLIGLSVTTESNIPTYWYKVDQTVSLWPDQSESDDPVTLTIEYIKTPTLLTGVGSESLSVPESYHTDVANFCVAKAHARNNNLTAERAVMEMYERNIPLRDYEAHTPDGPQYKLGDPLDYNEYEPAYYGTGF